MKNIINVMINIRELFIEYVKFIVELIVNRLYIDDNFFLSILVVDKSCFDILV